MSRQDHAQESLNGADYSLSGSLTWSEEKLGPGPHTASSSSASSDTGRFTELQEESTGGEEEEEGGEKKQCEGEQEEDLDSEDQEDLELLAELRYDISLGVCPSNYIHPCHPVCLGSCIEE